MYWGHLSDQYALIKKNSSSVGKRVPYIRRLVRSIFQLNPSLIGRLVEYFEERILIFPWWILYVVSKTMLPTKSLRDLPLCAQATKNQLGGPCGLTSLPPLKGTLMETSLIKAVKQFTLRILRTYEFYRQNWMCEFVQCFLNFVSNHWYM